MTEASSQTKPRMFLSYSRRDAVFVDELVISIESYGFDVVIDRADLFPGEPWEPRLHRMITEADTTVCVVSQNWISSDQCKKEVTIALGQGRRVIPAVIHPVDPTTLPPDLARLQFVLFPEGRHARGVVDLIETLRTDIGWVREQSRLLDKADEWDSQERPPALLLRDVALTRALEWANGPRPRNTLILPVVSDYVEASRSGQNLEEKKRLLEEKSRLRAHARFAMVGFAAAVFALISVGAVGHLIYDKLQQTSDDLEEANTVLDLTEAQNDRPAFEPRPAPPETGTASPKTPSSEPLSPEPAGELSSTTNDKPSDPAPPLPPTPEPVPDTATLRQLILSLDDADRATRLRAGQQVADLVRGPNARSLLSPLIQEVELPRLDNLSAAGRVNVLFMLNTYDGWQSSALAPDLGRALSKIEERAAQPVNPKRLGAQTQGCIASLKIKIAGGVGGGCGT